MTGSATIDADFGWLRSHVLDDDGAVELRDVTEDLAVIGLWGPMARDVFQIVTRDDVSDEAIPFMRARTVNVGGASVLAQRVTYVGELGWELYVDPEWAVQVWDRLWSAGEPQGMAVAGYRALDSLRIEKGYRAFGSDLTMLDDPFEAGLGSCVRLNKGGFVGRDALAAKQQAGGSGRRLRTLLVGDAQYLTIYGGEAVLGIGGAVVGRLRSCAYGFTIGRNVGSAYLPVELEPGEPLEVDVFGRRVPAEIAADASIDPGGQRIQG